MTDKVRNGIFSSLRQILEKRVLPSLCPLFDNSKLDRELRIKIRETFKEFCLPSNADPGNYFSFYINLHVKKINSVESGYKLHRMLLLTLTSI